MAGESDGDEVLPEAGGEVWLKSAIPAEPCRRPECSARGRACMRRVMLSLADDLRHMGALRFQCKR